MGKHLSFRPLCSGLLRCLWVTTAVVALVAASCGDDAEPTGSARDGTASSEPAEQDAAVSDRSAYGVDLSGLELPEADPYGGHRTVEDDTGQVEIVIPTAWRDVDTSAARRDGVEVPGIWASTDLEALNTGYGVPGLQVDLRTASDGDVLLALLNSDNATADECTDRQEFDYDDGLYTGTAELWTGCTDEDVALLEVVALRAGNQYITLEIQMRTDADVDAAVQALKGFTATEVEAGRDWTSDGTGSPQVAPTQHVGDVFNLVVVNNPSVGDNWEIADPGNAGVARFVYEDFESDNPDAAGAGGRSYFSFVAVAPGTTTVTLRNCFGCDEDGSGGRVTETASVEITVAP